jgi:hypothetical protein
MLRGVCDSMRLASQPPMLLPTHRRCLFRPTVCCCLGNSLEDPCCLRTSQAWGSRQGSISTSARNLARISSHPSATPSRTCPLLATASVVSNSDRMPHTCYLSTCCSCKRQHTPLSWEQQMRVHGMVLEDRALRSALTGWDWAMGVECRWGG